MQGHSLSGKSPRSIVGSMWTYPWDLIDEGYEEVLKTVSQHGMKSISLATAYHAGKFLSLHNPKHKVVFPEDGTVYFNPDAARYARVKPRVNSLVRAGEGLEMLVAIAGRFGLTTRSWIVCCHNTALGMEYPDIACENAFGDKIYHNLCPSNPDLRQFIRALVSDIAERGVETIELEALQFQGYTHGFHHEREGIELSFGERILMGLCFCPSCISRSKATGLDINPVREYTRRKLEDHFKNPRITSDRLMDADGLPPDLLEPFFEWRTTVVSSLVEELAEISGPASIRQMVGMDPVSRKIAGVDPASSAKIAGGVLALGYVRDGLTLQGMLESLRRLVKPSEIILGQQVGLPESGGREEFRERMTVAKTIGIRDFNFYNYGFIPIDHLQWIRDVISD